MSWLYWTLVLAGNIGLAAWLLRQGPRIGAAVRDLADTFAPGADWPALAVAGAIVLTIWSIA